ncbi:MAG: MoaD/ThiS family protein [Verrucomicrobiota bacterium]|jgi:molybdopterin converting factor subunit 1
MRILFFAHLKDAAACSELELHCGDVDTAGLWNLLIQARPGLAPHRGVVRLAKNLEYARPDTLFGDQDEVALIPPVSGG